MNGVKQIPWVGGNIQGHAFDTSGQIDSTEGFGAFDHVLSSHALGTRIVDVGGGAFDANSAYVAEKYQLDCSVYDPYKRSEEHNKRLITKSASHPFDAALSFSVLNVISEGQARMDHIHLCRDFLKPGGKAIFKVWPGDQTGVGKQTASGYQSNRSIDTYVDEIQTTFGSQNVFFDPKAKTIRCSNPVMTYPSGTRSI